MAATQLSWQRQLLQEHEQICRYYRLHLPTPLLVVDEDSGQRPGCGRAGSWCATPAPGVIRIAGWLIREHGWEVVRELLKHEMCHQYVEQVLGRGHEPPHGPAFQEACRRLGVHPLFRRAQSAIPHLLPQAASGREGNLPPILAKVEKLLALAGSANEHEASLAMAKAGELMRRHNLQRLDDAPSATDCDYLVIKSGRRRQAAHHLHLAALLQDFFYVKTISYSLYQPQQEMMERVLELLGRRENLAVAEYVYHFLEGQLPRLWQQYRRQQQAPGRARNSYYIGVLTGFREQLRRREQQEHQAAHRPHAPENTATSEDNKALTCSRQTCARDPQLNLFMRQRYPHLRRSQRRGSRLHAASYRAGQADGDKLVLHKGIHHRQGNLGKLL